MALRIFYGVIALIVAFLSYDIYRIYNVHDELGNPPAEYSLGPEDADVTIVEFLDYSCHYCREIHPTIIEAVRRDGRVRYAPRPLPSENPDAVHAAIFAYAAGLQGKFMEMHDYMITNFGPVDEDILATLSQSIGLDLSKMSKDINDSSVEEKLYENGRLFLSFGGESTPFFVINGTKTFIPEGQMPTVDDFLQMFNEARAGQ